MHRIALVLFVVTAPLWVSVHAQTSPCNNSGFEQTAPGSYTTANSVTGWSVSSASNSICSSSLTWVPGSSEFSVVSTPISNPDIGTIPHSPLGGTNIAVLNNRTANNSITRLQKKFTVTTSNALVALVYAGAWQTATHSCCAQAGFSFRITDTLGTPLICSTYSFSGTSCTNITYSVNGTGAAYSNWSLRYFDLSPSTGSAVVLEIEAHDCSNGDHWGYTYFEIQCQTGAPGPPSSPPGPTSYFCPGATGAQLIAPIGYTSYNWMYPVGYPISPQQSTLAAPTITNAVANNVYTVQLTTASGCVFEQTVSLQSNTISIVALQASPSCSNGASGSASVAAAGSSTGYSYTWLNSTNSVVSTYFAATGLPVGNYTVQVQAAGSQSTLCGIATATVQVGIAPPLQNKSKAYCSGQPSHLAAPAGSNYQWYNLSGPISPTAGGTASALTVMNPTNGAAFTVAFNSPHGCRDSIKFTLGSVPPGTLGVTSNSLTCAGTNTGSAVISLTPSVFFGNYIPSISVTSLSGTATYSNFTIGNVMALTGLQGGGNYSVTAFDGVCWLGMSFSVNTLPRPNPGFYPALASTVCAGQSLPCGIASPSPNVYNYSWTPTTWMAGNNGQLSQTIITPTLPVGTSSTLVYTIVVNPTVMPCPTQVTFTVTALHPITPTVSAVQPLCQNATVQLTGNPVGGTFQIPGQGASQTGILHPATLSPGVHQYTYEISWGPCISSATAPFTTLETPMLSVSGKTNICKGDTALLTASGGDNIIWPGLSNNNQVTLTPVSTSTYSLHGTNLNGCSASKIVTVQVTDVPVLSVSAPSLICLGKSATLVVSGAQNYLWSTNESGTQVVVTPTSTSTYTVTGTNLPGNCTDTSTIPVIVIDLPVIQVSGPDSVCHGDLVILTASGATSYIWNGAPGASTNTFVAATQTNYTVTGTDSHGCEKSVMFMVQVEPCTDISEHMEDNPIWISPNPTNAKTMVGCSLPFTLRLFTIEGKPLQIADCQSGACIVDLSDLPPGIYLMIAEIGESIVKKMIIKSP